LFAGWSATHKYPVRKSKALSQDGAFFQVIEMEYKKVVYPNIYRLEQLMLAELEE